VKGFDRIQSAYVPKGALMWWRLALSSVLLTLFVSGAWFNIQSWSRRGRGERCPSIAPLFCGIAGTIGLLLLPVPHMIWFAWLALILDVGCLPYFVAGSINLAHEAYIHSQRFLVMQLQGTSETGKESEVNLYRNGDCILKQTGLTPPAYSLSMMGRWQQESDAFMLEFAGKIMRYELGDGSVQYQWSENSDLGMLEGVRLQVIENAL